MLRKRIIFTLIYENSKFNQSRNFRLQKVGDINWLEKNYKFKDIAFSLDELIVLNASKKEKNLENFAQVLQKLVDDVFIPIAAGGGIRSLKDAKLLFNSGADKLVLNSTLYDNPDFVKEIVRQYGSQSVVASVDYKIIDGLKVVFINDGIKAIDMSLEDYIKYIQYLGVGELYLNSIDKDGTGFGYDLDTIDELSNSVNIPLIIAGGAGNESHLLEGLKRKNVDAVATANLFNFIGNGLPNTRKKIIEENLNIARWLQNDN
ncbi:HisA/HisF-related TIM barrel protein [Aliarcobacter skirrowii]|uniref:HisA/HisF-related TIM barrel protein n=1 Tax=Aliarcobacter skirrowii TaxID=28200 RepID=A0AAW9D9T8_9BACT|nr:HisA/HisF-related TIM barrel protein [Aliarcobacter skirrowii]MDX4039813.1 HisA/HisF-related TIM barrel protein [Aliarcobacter skirrowii]MDX4069043.1 HisA/HisF-related TIM barrel protein [Aliarcobacter skirrowii]